MYLPIHSELRVQQNRILGSFWLRIYHQRYQQVPTGRAAQILSTWQNEFIHQTAQHVWLPQKSSRPHQKRIQPPLVSQRQAVIFILCRDLLITIKRKIKGKIELKNEQVIETPLKARQEVESSTANSKNVVQTGQQLTTLRQFGQSFNNISFNILGTKQKLHSIMNLNCSVNVLPQPDLADINLNNDIDESDDQASIADKIEIKEER